MVDHGQLWSIVVDCSRLSSIVGHHRRRWWSLVVELIVLERDVVAVATATVDVVTAMTDVNSSRFCQSGWPHSILRVSVIVLSFTAPLQRSVDEKECSSWATGRHAPAVQDVHQTMPPEAFHETVPL